MSNPKPASHRKDAKFAKNINSENTFLNSHHTFYYSISRIHLSLLEFLCVLLLGFFHSMVIFSFALLASLRCFKIFPVFCDLQSEIRNPWPRPVTL